MALPGFFFNIDLGGSIPVTLTETNDVAGLNFAVVMADSEGQVQHRWTTWGLEADAMFLYQSQSAKNKVLVGNEGIIYVLDEDAKLDAGVPIPLTWISAPLPTVDEDNDAQTMVRTHHIKWAIRTTPPSTGFSVRVTLVDVDTGATTYRDVVQYTQKMHVHLTLKARQFRIKFEVTGSGDFDLSYLAYTYQSMGVRKTTRIS